MTLHKRLLRSIGLWSLSLFLFLVVWELSPLDIIIQDQFFDFQNQEWLVSRDNLLFRIIFYKGMKIAVIFMGVSCLAISFFPKKWLQKLPSFLPKIRKPFIGAVLSIALIPAFVGYLKDTTDIYFPSQIIRYGGEMPYVKLYQPFPENIERTGKGHGFPAGHASGGYALFGLVFLAAAHWRKRVWWAAFVYGSLMALYQTVNGAHYLSHTIVTIHIAWIFVLFIGLILNLNPFPAKKNKI